MKRKHPQNTQRTVSSVEECKGCRLEEQAGPLQSCFCKWLFCCFSLELVQWLRERESKKSSRSSVFSLSPFQCKVGWEQKLVEVTRKKQNVDVLGDMGMGDLTWVGLPPPLNLTVVTPRSCSHLEAGKRRNFPLKSLVPTAYAKVLKPISGQGTSTEIIVRKARLDIPVDREAEKIPRDRYPGLSHLCPNESCPRCLIHVGNYVQWFQKINSSSQPVAHASFRSGILSG